MRKKLEAEGRLDTPTKATHANASIDVLAEISAHGVPLTLGHTTSLKRTVVKAADPSKGVPILPSQAQVLGEMSRGNIGGTWYSVLTDAVEPHAAAVAAADGPSLVARGANRPLTPRQQAQLAEQARASAGAFRSLVLGSAFCVVGGPSPPATCGTGGASPAPPSCTLSCSTASRCGTASWSLERWATPCAPSRARRRRGSPTTRASRS